MRRAQSLWTLLHDDPRYSFFGRLVCLNGPGNSAPDRIAALTALQSAGTCWYYPAADAASFCAEMESRGLLVNQWIQCLGGDTALAASQSLLEQYRLPEDLSVITVDVHTPLAQVADLANLSLACGVMPVPGSAMRGESRKGICLLALDAAGNAVATASSYMNNHPNSANASDAFWGMLATRDDWRGQRIALLLGAQVIVSMWETHGARAFTTGINADNATSMALCEKLGVIPSDWVTIACTDPQVFGASTHSK